DVVTVSPAIVFADGLWEDLYVELPDGSKVRIVATTADDELELEDASGVNVGDHIALRADSNGTRIDEIAYPGAARRIVQTIREEGVRGERNYTRNPFFSAWPAGFEIHRCTVAVGSNGTTLNLTGLPNGLAITDDD